VSRPDDPTEPVPPLADWPPEPPPTDPIAAQRAPSIGRSSGVMAVANLVSRITGFLRQVVLVGVLGVGVLNDAYTVSNTLPNIVYELLFGGVLTSVMVPLLVRAQKEDADGGETYIRRLITLAGAALLVGTALAVLAAPLLTRLYLGGQSATANPELATALAYLLLPQILFYGLGALLGAILNTRGSFGAFAWAPVLNNLVVLGVLGVYALMPGEISLDPVRMGDPKLLLTSFATGVLLAKMTLIGYAAHLASETNLSRGDLRAAGISRAETAASECAFRGRVRRW
jgi:putative peptidoglycan lipid II flippase